ncbi:MAG: hypothetical protein ABJP45_03875 [Cyclobacteriaceae bacterium]
MEFRAYPAGQMFMLRGEQPIKSRSAISFYVGYNRTDRKDYGEHDNEEGGGFGGGLGYKKYVKQDSSGFYVGLENFIWKLDIDWKEPVSGAFSFSGTTEILVLQPAFNFGYKHVPESRKWYAELGFAFGAEINVKTIGSEVGQGGISMITASFGFSL